VSETVAPAHRDLLPLPGFLPDAVPFALRTTIALLLAYLVSFTIQLDTASSAGLCVAIVAQPSPGMAVSKAIYRAAGTILGGVAALVFIACFPQDRTMLLLCFTLWLGGCTFVAALLRDFRSYGAVLCGYTVGIIALSGIDTPDAAWGAALNRVAAILIGILSVAVVNTLLSRPIAYEGLVDELKHFMGLTRQLALDTLEGRAAPDIVTTVNDATQILALRTQATYASAETAGGGLRRDGAVAAIAGMLSMLSACRALAGEAPCPESASVLQRAATALQTGKPSVAVAAPRTPSEAFFAERANELLAHHSHATEGLQVLEGHGRTCPQIRMRVHHDVIGAALSAIRTVIGVALGCVFCVLAGWPGATLLLVQQAAFTALLGMTPNPSAAGVSMGWALPLPVIAAWLVGYILLPNVSGFVPFSVAVGSFAFAFALAGRHHRLTSYGAGFMLYYALLLSPSETETFDLSAYGNSVLVQGVAVVFMIVAFHIVLPVSRKRRLFRIFGAVAGDLQKTLARGRTLNEAPTHLLEYDRLAQAQVWVGRRTPARIAVLARMGAMIDLDLELRRAWSGLLRSDSGPAAVAQARAALLSRDPGQLEQAATLLLATAGPDAPRHGIAGLHRASRIMAQQCHAMRHYGMLRRP
jgi:uncharacterized membrane protein YccC